MGHGSEAQTPLRITPEFANAGKYHIESIDRKSGYQVQQKYRAAKRLEEAVRQGDYIWLGIAGASTPVGFGGLYSDLIERGIIDVIVCTGANAYHDLHFACGLPVRHGEHKVDDNALFKDETTRIYTQFIHNRYTLKAQDMLNQKFLRRVLEKGKLKGKFSTAQLLYELGIEMLEDTSSFVVDKKGSFVLRAAENGVPIFLDSGSNHSLNMDFTLLSLEGYDPDTSPTEDMIQAAALSMHTQPQVNLFLGEGGPRNYIQTTAPTASEIYYLSFDGSDTCIRFTTADVRAGALSGSGQDEAVTWGKYPDADPRRDIEVWGEYTTTFPDVAGYVGQLRRNPRRLMNELPELSTGLKKRVIENMSKIRKEQGKIEEMLPAVIKEEIRLRKKAGYEF